MILAGMIRTDETALICDLAETYGVMDYRALPLKTAAALSSGLRENSRIRMKMSGQKADTETLLLAAAVDRLSLLLWARTKDAQRGANKPASILAKMTEEKKESEYEAFRTPEEFEAARQRLFFGSE